MGDKMRQITGRLGEWQEEFYKRRRAVVLNQIEQSNHGGTGGSIDTEHTNETISRLKQENTQLRRKLRAFQVREVKNWEAV